MLAPNPLKGNPLQRLDMARFHRYFDEAMLMHIMETFWDCSPTEQLPE